MLRSRPTPEISGFHKQTFKALRPWLDERNPGEWWDGAPRFRISKRLRELAARHRQGERGLTYRDGSSFEPWHLPANYLKPKDIKEAVAGEKVYYTGGRDGSTLLYIDVDAHEPWQDDVERTNNVICDFLGAGNLLWRRSGRGLNAYLKLWYGLARWRGVNQALKDFEKKLKAYCASQGCKCAVELKGLIRESDEHAGTLAKLPCYGLEPWTEKTLQDFERLPVRGLSWLLRKTRELAEATPNCRDNVKTTPRPGSTSGLPFKVEEVTQLLGSKAVRHRAAYLYAMHVAPRRGRLTVEDFVQAWCLLEFLRPNEDGSMPSARVKAVWCRLYQEGALPRAWDDSRWSAIWQTLADCGFLAVQDAHYWFIGGKHEGQAMKWRLDEAYSLQETQEEASLQEVPPRRPGLYRPQLVPAPVFDLYEWTPERLTDFLLGIYGDT